MESLLIVLNKVMNVDKDPEFGDLTGKFVMAEVTAVGPFAMQGRVLSVSDTPQEKLS